MNFETEALEALPGRFIEYPFVATWCEKVSGRQFVVFQVALEGPTISSNPCIARVDMILIYVESISVLIFAKPFGSPRLILKNGHPVD